MAASPNGTNLPVEGLMLFRPCPAYMRVPVIDLRGVRRGFCDMRKSPKWWPA
jgi:hypothetical protein